MSDAGQNATRRPAVTGWRRCRYGPGAWKPESIGLAPAGEVGPLPDAEEVRVPSGEAR